MDELEIFKLAVIWARDYCSREMRKGRPLDSITVKEMNEAAEALIKDYDLVLLDRD